MALLSGLIPISDRYWADQVSPAAVQTRVAIVASREMTSVASNRIDLAWEVSPFESPRASLDTCSFSTPALAPKKAGRRPVNKRQFACLICKRTFKWPHSLARHSQVHSEETLFNCSLCFQSFKSFTSLSKHARMHSDDGRPFDCLLCTKRFKTWAALTKHSGTHSKPANMVRLSSTGQQHRHACANPQDVHCVASVQDCNRCESNVDQPPLDAESVEVLQGGFVFDFNGMIQAYQEKNGLFSACTSESTSDHFLENLVKSSAWTPTDTQIVFQA